MNIDPVRRTVGNCFQSSNARALYFTALLKLKMHCFGWNAHAPYYWKLILVLCEQSYYDDDKYDDDKDYKNNGHNDDGVD